MRAITETAGNNREQEMDSSDRTRHVKDLLWVLAYLGVVAMVFRLAFGLGATTHLDDRVPWGLWKIFNMVAGAALATSGFTIGFLGHVLHVKPFDRMVKPAVLVAFLGYGASLFALLFDIGLPWRFWHPFVFWNPHSFLFEVFWCVSCYFVITFLELSPVLVERLGLKMVHRLLKGIAPVLVMVGITLSCLHHTSLGSLFLVTPARLYVLWYSPIISLLFIVSAIGGGMMLLALILILHSWWYDPERIFAGSVVREGVMCRPCPDGNGDGRAESCLGLKDVRALVVAGAVVLSVYLLLKIGDLIARPEALHALFSGSWESVLYIIELLLAAVLPIALVALPAVRKSPRLMALAAGCGAAGLALNRMDVGIFGYFHDAGEVYFPSLIEWAITFGVIALAGLAFFFVVENFSVFDERWKQLPGARRPISSAFDRLTRIWNHRLLTGLERITLIAVLVLPLAWWLLYPPYRPMQGPGIDPPVAVDANRDTLLIDGSRNRFAVLFPHAAHKKRFGGDASCTKCHHLSNPKDQATPCSRCHRAMENRTRIFDHEQHMTFVARSETLGGLHPENHSCQVCHTLGEYRGASTAKGCLDCHKEDMHPIDPPDSPSGLMDAVSYHEAMHRTCIPCHTKEKERVNRPDLDRCATCHELTPGFAPPEGVGTKKPSDGQLVCSDGGRERSGRCQ